MGNEEDCNTRLCLAVGVGGTSEMNNNPSLSVACVDLSFTLFPRGEVTDVNHSDFSQNHNKSYSRRKKLRLTKEQLTLLEDSFKLHNTPNSSQKRALAERLNLKSRQVEVWFQNRRARTKLKQTEVNCQLLKKCCESLSDENRRLKKELQELHSQLIIFKAMCPSCEKMVRTSEGRK